MVTTRIPAVRAAVEILGDEGADQFFGSPGATALPWYGALEKADGLGHLMARHEQDAVHMADGWARTSGRTGVVVAVPERSERFERSGPGRGTGLGGLLDGLRAAWSDAVPLVCVTGRTVPPGRDDPTVPAAELVRSARPVTKCAVRVEDPTRIPQALRTAFRTAREGRPGPVLVYLPYGTADHGIPYAAVARPPVTTAPHPPDVAAVLNLLLAARRPLVLAGRGVRAAGAGAALRELVTYLGVPFQVTPRARGCVGEDHELYAGTAEVPDPRADFVLALGIGGETGGISAGGRTVVRVDAAPRRADPDGDGRAAPGGSGTALVCDLLLSLEALLAAAEERGAQADGGRWAALTDHRPPTGGPLTACRVITEAVAADGHAAHLVTDAVLYRLCGGPRRADHGARRYVACGRDGPPGRPVPAAIGVRMALDAQGHRDTAVVALVRVHELRHVADALAVAARHELPFVLAAIGPGGRGGTEALELMRAYGCSAHRADDPDDLRSAAIWACKEAVTTARPVLLLATARTTAEVHATTPTQLLTAGVPRPRTPAEG
ncbi:thiamine pyrophosphate-binding protein [Streptomyces sp. NPDC018019]|uniref:thiamine pyrophosphate-binding protein n=1 Tax=Streptomyces sp. NPDC018019 TaxID=3365030 RepID=UPI0037901A98